MSQQITTHDVNKYNTNLQLLSQQLTSRFRSTGMESVEHGRGSAVVEQFDEVTAQERVGRHTTAPIIDTPSDRRWAHPRDWDWGDVVDEEDRLRILISPDGQMVKNGLGAQNRRLDDQFVTALHGAALTGQDGTTSTTLPAGNIVAVTVGAGAATGMNTDKILAARKIILDGNVELEDPSNRMYCAIGPLQEQELLDQVKIVNTDYQNGARLSENSGLHGKTWFGITFVVSTRLILDTNSDRECALYCKSGMHTGIWQEISGDIVVRNDLTRHPFYVSTKGTFGCTRTEEAKVMQILCTEN